MSNDIEINFKLYSGIHTDAGIKDYDPVNGIVLSSKQGVRLRTALKKIGLKNISGCICFRSGARIGLWDRLNNGDEISCLRASGGG